MEPAAKHADRRVSIGPSRDDGVRRARSGATSAATSARHGGRIHRSPRSEQDDRQHTNVLRTVECRHLCSLEPRRRPDVASELAPANARGCRGRARGRRITRASNPHNIVPKNFFRDSFVPRRGPTRTPMLGRAKCARTPARTRRVAACALRERALLCPSHSAPTPRTPPLASQHLLDRTRSAPNLIGSSAPAASVVSDKRSASVRRCFRGSRATCVFVCLPLRRAAGCVRRALGAAAGAAAGTAVSRRPITPRRPPHKRHRRNRPPFPNRAQRGDAFVASRARGVSRTRRRL